MPDSPATDTIGLPDYDKVVADYEAFAEPATAAFGREAIALAQVQPGEEVLDVAAGTGAVALPLIEHGAFVTAIDFSPPMVARLTERIADRNGGRALVMDGQALTFADNSFDLALSLFGVMLFPDFRAGLAEMARVVRPGGRVVIGCWAGLTAPMQLLTDAVAAALPDRANPTTLPGMTAMGSEAGMRTELAAMGLSVESTTAVTLPWTSPPRAEMVARMSDFFAMLPPWRELNAEDRAAVERAMETIAQRDADRPFESTAIIGLARKPSGDAD